MSQSEIKIFATISILLASLIWVVHFLCFEYDVISLESLKYLNVGITITATFWAGYFRWLWKYPYIKKILYRPNVNGTWIGEFESNWKNQNGETNPPAKFVLVVRQHWFSTSIRAFTERQKTESYVETLLFDQKKGLKILAYLFSEKASGIDSTTLRQGAAELELAENACSTFLEGHFWTRAGTEGYVKVKIVDRKSYVESFSGALEKWNIESDWKTA